jgi:hypothetical protein
MIPRYLHPRKLALIALTLAQVGCGAGWRRVTETEPRTLPARQQVQVWQDGHALQLHAVAFGIDSVSGVPYLQPSDCDSCRVSIGASEVDSVRVGNPPAGFWRSFALVLGGGLVLTFVGCLIWGCELADT